jgi:hypothetical protein
MPASGWISMDRGDIETLKVGGLMVIEVVVVMMINF